MPKPEKATPETEAVASVGEALPQGGFRYEIKGLELSDHMPIQFEGATYDLANLTPEQHAYLLGFPDKVPYL